MAADRYAFFAEFFKNFYNTDMFLGKRVSEEVVRASWNIAAAASATASLACVPTWHEDFRQDLVVLTCRRWSFTAMLIALFRSRSRDSAPPNLSRVLGWWW